MNKINRPLVKMQAKQIIKGKVFQLFLISFLIMLLTGSGNVFKMITDLKDFDFNKSFGNEFFDDYSDNNEHYFDKFDDFDFDDFENPIDGFEFNSKTTDDNIIKPVSDFEYKSVVSNIPIIYAFGNAANLIGLALISLNVALSGVYLSLIRRNVNENFDLNKEFSGVFKNTFDSNYFKKFVGVFLVNVLTVALCCLFIIPGIVFAYSAYFTFQIMIDNPNLKPSEAIKLSKKIVKGNRMELFIYDLSFIPWFILGFLTFGLAFIYSIPYKSTCDALYYENFRLRALAQGRVTEDDFLSFEERMRKYSADNLNQYQNYYAQGNAQQGTAYQQYGQYQPYQPYQQNMPYGGQPQYAANNSGTFFTPDFNSVNQYNPFVNQYQPPQSNAGAGDYCNPQQNAQPQQNPYTAQPEQGNVQNENTSNPFYYNPPKSADSDINPDNSTPEN